MEQLLHAALEPSMYQRQRSLQAKVQDVEKSLATLANDPASVDKLCSHVDVADSEAIQGGDGKQSYDAPLELSSAFWAAMTMNQAPCRRLVLQI